MNTLCSALIACSFLTSASLVAQDTKSFHVTPGTSTVEPAVGPQPAPIVLRPRQNFRYAASLTAGSLGIGGEFTYAFNRYLAARAGVHGLPLSISAESNGFPFTADIKLLNGTFQVDYAPFGGRFRISPGLLAYNGLSARAHANVAAGQTFDLNDDTYTSSAIDPIKADASFKFGRNAAPMLTIGWSNLLPSKRFAMPLEIGAVFTGTAKFNFDLSGTACDSHGSCGNIATEPDAQADLNAERAKWRDTLSDIPIYPILSIGFSYRFGGMGAQ